MEKRPDLGGILCLMENIHFGAETVRVYDDAATGWKSPPRINDIAGSSR